MITENFQTYLNKHASPELQQHLLSVLSSRGKGKGFVLNTAPSGTKQPLKNAIWNAVMFTMAPMRAQMYNAMFMKNEHKKVFDLVETWCTLHQHAVKVYMQKPFQFNLYAHRYDVERMQTELLKVEATI